MKWSDLTIEQFNDLNKLYELPIQEEERAVLMAQICFPDKTFDLDMPYTELMKYVNQINNLGEIKYKKIKSFKLNDVEYTVTYDIKKFSTSQYVDYTNYAKEKKPLWYNLSVVCVPKGHNYNDGYDIDEVIENLKKLDCVTALSVNFTIAKSSSKYIRTLVNYLSRLTFKMAIKEWFRSQNQK